MTPRTAARWIGRYSDPAGVNPRSPPLPLPASATSGDIDDLLHQAASHNVLPAFARNVEADAKGAPHALFAQPSAAQASLATLRQQLRDTQITYLARSMMLAETTRTLRARIEQAGLPAVGVKGLDFAEHGYGGLHLRAFSDVDLLVAPEAAAELAGIVTGLGFTAIAPSGKRETYTERQFVRPDRRGGQELVEIHTDMVHVPKLRRNMSLTYSTYAGDATPGVTMAGRLILAALHGATSHLFDRVQYVVDMMVIARAGVDARELAERCRQTGATVAVRTGLELVRRMFDCPEAAALLRALPASASIALTGRLISPASVLHAHGAQRGHHSWRRQAYRWLLTHAGAR